MDSYNAHFYAPSLEEIDVEIEREGSFAIERLEIFQGKRIGKDDVGAETVAMSIRAIQEPFLRQRFRQDVIEKLFGVYSELVQRELTRQSVKSISIICVLRKLPP